MPTKQQQSEGISTIPRGEYPRPILRRERWLSLNGPWRFGFDDNNIGLAAGWQMIKLAPDSASPFNRQINVPFAYQSELSGIGDRTPHDTVWYARTFASPRGGLLGLEERLLLHFGAVDYEATVWVNGVQVAQHRGGNTPFSADITHQLCDDVERQVIVVRAVDRNDDLAQPRGKQYWREQSENIYYTPTTGIWQSVWLEPVPVRYIDHVLLVPDIDTCTLRAEIDIAGGGHTGLSIEVEVSHNGEQVTRAVVSANPSTTFLAINMDTRGALPPYGDCGDWSGCVLWSPERPALYDLQVRLLDNAGARLDEISSYAGMRKVSIWNGRFLLNNRPYFQRLVLDQGYFPSGLLTAPTDEDLRRDIELAKELGFNGARKHQKVEDPRWHYWADRLGFLSWGEMANAFNFSREYIERFTAEWIEVVRHNQSYPSVIVWTPMNESWGVPSVFRDVRQRAHLLSLYHLTRSLDPTRPVVSNDGWEHAETDLVTIHDYRDSAALAKGYATVEESLSGKAMGRQIFVPGYRYHGQPIMITEFGGNTVSGSEGWGYETAKTKHDLLKKYAAQVDALVKSDIVQGFCYTQLTDVEQETNGLLTYDRQHKLSPDEVKRITTWKAKTETFGFDESVLDASFRAPHVP
ncbi:hypothetical protein GP486_003935 [Trichoglossum hirsutum]|uniref:Glycoside hydrolase family 2 n=1 Tax=Trichoglossum hirsutum TaxID=265104 RepID=A0A9P8LC67_9PEZI|nr:hypothetical protein GP486_003935 [Trichoglossum hirsutum]